MRCHWKQCGHSSRSISPSSDTWEELPSHPQALSPEGEIATRDGLAVLNQRRDALFFALRALEFAIDNPGVGV